MTKQLKSEIIAVGTELLLGQIADTNAQWISQQLAQVGLNTYHHSVVGDNLDRVRTQFEQAAERSDIIIITGGLGPTEDDLTREAFQSLADVDIVEHQPSMEKITAFFEKQGSSMTPNNKKQARVFEGAKVIENHAGMAPGMMIHRNGQLWVFVPGVPREMKPMITDHIIPEIIEQTGEQTVIRSTMLRFIGIGESQLEHELKETIEKQSNPTIAPLAQSPGVSIRLTAKANTPDKAADLIEQTKQEIFQKTGSYCYGIDDVTLESYVFNKLKEKGWTIAAAESLTGGRFSDRMVRLEGASAVFAGGIICYNTNVKEKLLNVSADTIRDKGAVSEECALEMAVNVREKLNSTIGISFTGVAGPDTTEGKAPGTVYIAIIHQNGYQQVEKFTFAGTRQMVRNRSVIKGYELLFHNLKT